MQGIQGMQGMQVQVSEVMHSVFPHWDPLSDPTAKVGRCTPRRCTPRMPFQPLGEGACIRPARAARGITYPPSPPGTHPLQMCRAQRSQGRTMASA